MHRRCNAPLTSKIPPLSVHALIKQSLRGYKTRPCGRTWKKRESKRERERMRKSRTRRGGGTVDAQKEQEKVSASVAGCMVAEITWQERTTGYRRSYAGFARSHGKNRCKNNDSASHGGKSDEDRLDCDETPMHRNIAGCETARKIRGNAYVRE